MQLYIDGSLSYATTAGSLNAPVFVSSGAHALVAQSWDAAGGIHKRSVDVTVQSEAVVVTAPAPNAVVASPFNLSATAGGANEVTSMQVYVDNISLYQTSVATVNANLTLNSGQHNVVVQSLGLFRSHH